MQVTIGIKHVARELSLDTTVSQEEVLAAVAGAAEADVTLSDDKGRKVFIPAARSPTSRSGRLPRRVGFGV